MRFLLIGEYSRFHNSIKEGLLALGHEVLLVGTGDYFKKFPVDINIDAVYFKYNKVLNFLRQGFFRITTLDLAYTETAIRYWFHMRKFKGFDVVQLINSNAIKTHLPIEKYFITKLKKENKSLYLSACGDDCHCISFLLKKNPFKYHILTPYLKDNSLKSLFKAPLKYITPPFKNLYAFVYNNCNGIIAADIDYHIPLLEDKKYLGLVPNPINVKKIEFIPLIIKDKIKIFHGINMTSSIKKGSSIIEEALNKIQLKYPNKVVIKITHNLSYDEYLNAYNDSHIIMDQVYSYDQGFNALEAMAKGKVVFTGAEREWLEYYNLIEDTVAINALPDAQYIADKLEWLINNPEKINEISLNARVFIEKEHDYIQSAKKYIGTWGKTLNTKN